MHRSGWDPSSRKKLLWHPINVFGSSTGQLSLLERDEKSSMNSRSRRYPERELPLDPTSDAREARIERRWLRNERMCCDRSTDVPTIRGPRCHRVGRSSPYGHAFSRGTSRRQTSSCTIHGTAAASNAKNQAIFLLMPSLRSQGFGIDAYTERERRRLDLETRTELRAFVFWKTCTTVSRTHQERNVA